MGHRPIPHLQRRSRTFVGGRGQRKRQPPFVGHFWRSRKRPSIRLRSFRRGKCPNLRPCETFLYSFARWTGTIMLQHQQSSIVAQLPAYVVSGDSSILSQHSRAVGRLQERSTVHVPGRGVFVTLSRSQPIRQGHTEKRSRDARRSPNCSQGIGTLLLRDFCEFFFNLYNYNG